MARYRQRTGTSGSTPAIHAIAIGRTVFRHSTDARRIGARRRRGPGRKEPDRPACEQHGHVEEVVAARQRLHEGRGRKDHEPSSTMRPQPLMETEQHEGHPVGRQNLEVHDVRHPERVETVDDAGQHRRRVPAGDRERERMRAERRQRERCHERRVVGERWAAAGPLQRSGQERKSHAVVGEGQAAVDGKEGEAVPPRGREGHHVRVPPQNPDGEQRIAEVVREVRREVSGKRPGEDNRQAGYSAPAHAKARRCRRSGRAKVRFHSQQENSPVAAIPAALSPSVRAARGS